MDQSVDVQEIEKIFRSVDNYLDAHKGKEVTVDELHSILQEAMPHLEIAASFMGGMNVLETWRGLYKQLETLKGQGHASRF